MKLWAIITVLLIALVQPLHATDMILTNGKIYTVNDTQPWAEAVVIKHGVIEFVGSSLEAETYQNSKTEVVDLDGKLVLPGFQDVHMHPLEAYAPPQDVCILEGGETIRHHLKSLRKCIDEQRDSEWLIGWGHWIDDIIDSTTMPKTLLDEINADKPMVLFSQTSHSNWINSAALKKIGWDGNTPNPPGGVIVKDEKTGEPNGILFDTAADMINELIYAPTEQKLEQTYQGLLEAIVQISANGITSLADARVYWSRKHHDVWLRAAQSGVLQARTVLALWAYPQFDDSQIDTLKSLYRNNANDLLRISEIKTYSDGLIGNTTAAMKTPYDVDFGITDNNRGLNYMDQNRLTSFITELEKTGFNFMIHAIGDRGVHEALNAIETAMKTNGNSVNRRHRITHAELIDDEDLPRFKSLEIGADFQLAGKWTQPAEYNAYTAPFIKNRVTNANRVRDVFETDAHLTLSSDYDVSAMNPLIGIQNALTRGAQSLPTVGDAIKAYTLNGAYALAQEDETGSIVRGKFADLIVLDKNIFELPADEIKHAQVLWTLLAGNEVFRHPDW